MLRPTLGLNWPKCEDKNQQANPGYPLFITNFQDAIIRYAVSNLVVLWVLWIHGYFNKFVNSLGNILGGIGGQYTYMLVVSYCTLSNKVFFLVNLVHLKRNHLVWFNVPIYIISLSCIHEQVKVNAAYSILNLYFKHIFEVLYMTFIHTAWSSNFLNLTQTINHVKFKEYKNVYHGFFQFFINLPAFPI